MLFHLFRRIRHLHGNDAILQADMFPKFPPGRAEIHGDFLRGRKRKAG